MAARSFGGLQQDRRRVEAQGTLPGALKSYREDLAIADRLARADPGNAEWQRDLSISLGRVAEILLKQVARGEARPLAERALSQRQSAIARMPNDPRLTSGLPITRTCSAAPAASRDATPPNNRYEYARARANPSCRLWPAPESREPTSATSWRGTLFAARRDEKGFQPQITQMNAKRPTHHRSCTTRLISRRGLPKFSRRHRRRPVALR